MRNYILNKTMPVCNKIKWLSNNRVIFDLFMIFSFCLSCKLCFHWLIKPIPPLHQFYSAISLTFRLWVYFVQYVFHEIIKFAVYNILHHSFCQSLVSSVTLRTPKHNGTNCYQRFSLFLCHDSMNHNVKLCYVFASWWLFTYCFTIQYLDFLLEPIRNQSYP